MAMQIFYAPAIDGLNYVLDEKESKHCIRVLRMVKGTQVRLIDGKGNLYEGYISDPDPKKCVIAVSDSRQGFEKRPYRLHIAISPLKNTERLEWFIEKSVEIGIDEITPLICKYSEKQTVKRERLENIIIAAMKQSLKAFKPVLNEPAAFAGFISGNHKGKRMIAHCRAGESRLRLQDAYSKGEDVTILIGPEGDFSENEIAEAIGRGYTSINLGSSRLRTETAGIAACHSVYFINL